MIWEQETASTLNMGLHIDLRILDDLVSFSMLIIISNRFLINYSWQTLDAT